MTEENTALKRANEALMKDNAYWEERRTVFEAKVRKSGQTNAARLDLELRALGAAFAAAPALLQRNGAVVVPSRAVTPTAGEDEEGGTGGRV